VKAAGAPPGVNRPCGRRWGSSTVPPRRRVVAVVAPLLGALLSAGALLGAAAFLVPSPACAKPEATRANKIRLLEGLGRAPELLIFGSSRAMRADPAYLHRLTGLRGFNCAVSSGTPAEAYAFMHLTRDLYPGTTQRYIWLLDMEQLRRSQLQPKLRTVPRLMEYLPERFQKRAAAEDAVGAFVSAAGSAFSDDDPALVDAAGQVLRGPVPTPAQQIVGAGSNRARSYGYRMVYRKDGYLIWGIRDYYAAEGYGLERCLVSSIYYFRLIYPRGFRAVRGTPAYFVREGIKQMNAWGVRPVIVLTPYHPDLRRAISSRGWKQRRAEVRRYFRHLGKTLDFKLLDFTSLASFRGWPNGFFDGIHPRPRLTNRMLKQVWRRSRPYLRPVPEPTPTPTPTPTATSSSTPSL